MNRPSCIRSYLASSRSSSRRMRARSSRPFCARAVRAPPHRPHLEGVSGPSRFPLRMTPATRPALVLGGASLCATLAVLLAGAQQADCSFFDWMFPAIVALQLCFALGAGFATGYRRPRTWHPVGAGLGASLVASLSGFIFFGFSLIGVLAARCGSDHRLAVFFVSLILTFIIAPVAIAGGAAAGWSGGQLARVKGGR